MKILATILEARPEMSIFLLKNGVAQILAEHLERCKIIRANVGTSEYSPVQSMDDLHDAMHLLGLLLPSQTRSSGESKKSLVFFGSAELQQLFMKPENSSLVAIFGEYLAPTLCHVVESPSNVTIKRKALSVLTAWTQLVDIGMFENVATDDAPIAAIVARALIDPQGELLKEAAHLCAMALEKSNEDDQEEEGEFIKEGLQKKAERTPWRFARKSTTFNRRSRRKERWIGRKDAFASNATDDAVSNVNKPEGRRFANLLRGSKSILCPGKAHLIASEGLDRLRKACAKLKAAPLSDSSEGKSARNVRDAKDFSSAFAKMFEALATSEISAFELSECGAADLAQVPLRLRRAQFSFSFSKSSSIDCEEHWSVSPSSRALPVTRRRVRLRRSSVFSWRPYKRENAWQFLFRNTPRQTLIHLTRDSAPRAVLHPLAPLATAGDPGLNLLARPLKVRLKRSSKCDATKVEDYGNSVVMIEPLAQLRAVEGFLYSRVKRNR